jgi:hypothetical protein
VLTFNSLLDSAVKLDASRWVQQAWMMRAAQHCDQKGFRDFIAGTWGNSTPESDQPQGKGIRSLMRDVGRGI